MRYLACTAPLIILSLTSLCTFAQNNFKAVLLAKSDSSIVPYALVKCKETQKSTTTNFNGEFEMDIPPHLRQLTFTISAIGVKAQVKYIRKFENPEQIYVDVVPEELNDVTITGLTAAEVVEKAIKLIPENYVDSSYFGFSSYRQYQLVNGVFRNLLEAKPVVMFRLTKTQKEIQSKEAYAVKQFRRSDLFDDPSNYHEDNIKDLLRTNPVYHLGESSLLPGRMRGCFISFDTVAKSDSYYVINYQCSFSTETHGWFDFSTLWLFVGESYETGRLMIDRSTFAFKKVERYAVRRPEFSYYFKPNKVEPGKYYMELVDGALVAEYNNDGSKWHLASLYHKYTNDFFDVKVQRKEFTVTDVAEWHLDSTSRYVSGEFVNDFYRKMSNRVYQYDKDFWEKNSFPFYFYDKDSVYRDISRTGPPDQQFYNSSIYEK